jgi:hypothetical protein
MRAACRIQPVMTRPDEFILYLTQVKSMENEDAL